MAAGRPMKLSELVFRKYDKDNSGTIELSELRKMAFDMGHPMTEEEFQVAVAYLDTKDADGVISYDEFAKWWADKDRWKHLEDQECHAEALQAAIAHFKYFDKNRDGFIDKGEFPALYSNLKDNRYPLTDLETAKASMDQDGDGKISLHEYLDWIAACTKGKPKRRLSEIDFTGPN